MALITSQPRRRNRRAAEKPLLNAPSTETKLQQELNTSRVSNPSETPPGTPPLKLSTFFHQPSINHVSLKDDKGSPAETPLLLQTTADQSPRSLPKTPKLGGTSPQLSGPPLESPELITKRPFISGPHSTRILPSKKPMPSQEVVNLLFNKLLTRLNLLPEKVAEMNMMSPEQKWSLILAQHELSSGLSCMYYIEQLVRHAQPTLKQKKVKRKLLEKLHPLNKVLKELEVELRTSQESWVSEFVSSPNHGHIALIDLLRDLIQYPGLLNATMPQKYAVLQRSPALVHNTLTCVRALMNDRHGFNAILNYVPSVYTITHCLTFPHYKTKTLVLKLLISLLLAPSGPKKILQAFDHYRRIKGEEKKFQTLVNSFYHQPTDSSYQAEVLRFINTVVQTANGLNARVFHAQEFLDAGLNIQEIEESLYNEPDERIAHELREWKKNYTNVQQLIDDLMIARGRARGLKQELDMTLTNLREANIERDNYVEYSDKLQERCKLQVDEIATLTASLGDIIKLQEERDDVKRQVVQLQDINQRYREHTNELRNKITKIVGEKELEGIEIDPTLDFQEKMEELEKHKTVTASTQTTMSMTNLTEELLTQTTKNEDSQSNTETEDRSGIPEAPPPPPLPGDIPEAPPLPGGIPNPPPLPGMGTQLRKPYITNLPLPTLNWVPIRNAEHTIFEDMNDEEVIEEMDFSEFENLFQVPRFTTAKDGKDKQQAEKQLQILDEKRARGVVFAKRRVKMEVPKITQFINNSDLDGLVPENCELLLQIVPQEKERAELAKSADQYKDFGEAEQFLYQLAKIPRLKERLSVITFIGTFDELLIQTQPKVDAVLNASLSIFRSSRLKKIFEVVLAFGNYMNSSKRGTVTGFKLVSLQRILDTRSTDKKQNLMHYIANVVEKVYPTDLYFYDDLKVNDACEVSLEMVDTDVENLKKGLETLQEEQTLDPNNFILFNFLKQVARKVEELAESYQKMKNAYTEVCLMFKESSKEEPAVFFGYFRTFITAWKTAIKENHSKKRKKMAPVENLLKKQNPEEIMKNLASEAASIAASRTQKFREETSKLQEIKEDTERQQPNPLETFNVQLRPSKDREQRDKMNLTSQNNTPVHEEHEISIHPVQTKDELSFQQSNEEINGKKRRPVNMDNILLDDEYYSLMMEGTVLQ